MSKSNLKIKMAFLKIIKRKLWYDKCYENFVQSKKNIWSGQKKITKWLWQNKKLRDMERKNSHLEITDIFSVSITWKLNENCSLSTKYPAAKCFFFVGHYIFLEHILEWTLLKHILEKIEEWILIVNWNNQTNIIRNER